MGPSHIAAGAVLKGAHQYLDKLAHKYPPTQQSPGIYPGVAPPAAILPPPTVMSCEFRKGPKQP